MFVGILPWTCSRRRSSSRRACLISVRNLIKKVLFPAEVLPIVTLLANMVHFFLGLPILAGFILYDRIAIDLAGLAWFPVVVWCRWCSRSASH